MTKAERVQAITNLINHALYQLNGHKELGCALTPECALPKILGSYESLVEQRDNVVTVTCSPPDTPMQRYRIIVEEDK